MNEINDPQPAPAAPPQDLTAEPTPPREDPRLARALEEYLRLLETGQKPNRHDFLNRYPAIAKPLAECIDGLEFVHGVAPDLSQPGAQSQQPPAPGAALQPEGPLGDFRLIREVGRGGMGVVYEAMQISLGRRVALKVLPFAAALDSKHLQRFKNEAQAAAHLQHTNIVPVHCVGCERGVHFYAMQFIDGQTLAAVIQDLRQLAAPEPRVADSVPQISAPSLAAELVSGRWAPATPASTPLHPTGPYSPQPAHQSPVPADDAPLTDTPPVAMLSTERSTKTPAFFRAVANLGVQAAEALEHAHQQGVIHRDIKPANLLVEWRAGGVNPLKLWISDFGLARLGSDAGLTMTGDLVGTIRYMSPEQALAKRVAVDGRTDIYSLGVTLYELLTLEPAYNGSNREEVLRQIAFDEPRPPRRLNAAVPPELETIVLKAIAKSPDERYATAQELADDLGRFLQDKPIKARRPSLRQRAAKWSKRHKTVVRAAGVIMILALVASLVSSALIWRAKEELRQTLERERVNSYYQRIALAEREWSANDLGRMQQTLEACPADLRGWEWHYLRRLPYRTLPPLNHDNLVHGAAFSPDSRRIASADHNGVVKVWDVQTGQVVFPPLQAHAGPCFSVAFSPDGRCFATRSREKIKIWDAETGEPIRTLEGNPAEGRLAFSPDGRRLSSALGKEVKIWEVATGDELLTLEGHSDNVRDVAFSPDGGRLASASDDRTVKVWDAESGRELLCFRSHTLKVKSVAFSPDSKRLASVAGEFARQGRGEAKVWDAHTGEDVLSLRGHASLMLSVAFSPDGRCLATAGGDRTVKLWDAATGQEILTLRGHRANWVERVAFSPDGTRLLSACTDRTVRIWDATLLGDETGEEVLTLRGHREGVRSVAFHPDGRSLVTAGDDEAVKVWDALSGRELRTLAGYSGMAVAFSRQGKYLALGGKGPAVWDATTWKGVFSLPTSSTAVAFGPEERLLAWGVWDGTVTLADIVTGQIRHRLRDHNYGILGLVFSPDGRTLASASADSSVRLWNLETGQELKTAPMRHVGGVSCLAFSPDGLQLASSGADQIVKIWDTATWRERRTLQDPTGGILSVAWSPDGRRLVWGGTDSTVKIADPVTGTILRTLRGHMNWVQAVAFSPDGHWIASASLDGTVKIWRATALSEERDPGMPDPDK
jgi:WD40 repeat protein/serine/threonine protein kinase